jgi:hypothetical protein
MTSDSRFKQPESEPEAPLGNLLIKERIVPLALSPPALPDQPERAIAQV